MQVNFQFIFSIKFTGKIKSILKLTMLRKFCEPETEGLHSSMQNMHFTFQLIFSAKFTGKIKSILKLAMQVNFQSNFRTKFTGQIKNILKLAMLHMFCGLETGSHSSMQNIQVTF